MDADDGIRWINQIHELCPKKKKKIIDTFLAKITSDDFRNSIELHKVLTEFRKVFCVKYVFMKL